MKNRIEVERTLIVNNAKLYQGDEAWFLIQRNEKNFWVYAKVIWLSDKQVVIEEVYSKITTKLSLDEIIEVSDKAPY